MMGLSKGVYHARLAEVDDVPRIGMDYMRVSEHGINSTVEGATGDIGVTMLVVKDFLHKSICVYPVEGKGVTMAEWLSGMIRADLATCGMDNSMISEHGLGTCHQGAAGGDREAATPGGSRGHYPRELPSRRQCEQWPD